jgi:hypothetical protein
MKRMMAFALALAGMLAAAEFWETKPYTRWTEQEIARVLVDSPWAKEVQIRFEGELEERIRAQQQTPPPPAASVSQVGRNGTGSGGPLGSMVGRKGVPMPGGTTVRVRWESAKPLREAIAATKRKPVEGQPDYYELVIDNIPPYTESRETAGMRDALLALSQLTWDKEAPVRATDATVLANADGLVVRLKFPRRTDAKAGSNVELHTRIGVSRVRLTFQTKAMVLAGRLEL